MKFQSKIEAKKGRLVGISSQNPELIDTHWKASDGGFTALTFDYHLDLDAQLGVLMDAVVQRPFGLHKKSEYQPGGWMMQPGVFCVTKEGKVIYKWTHAPSWMNASGTLGRASPAQVWKVCEKLLDGKKLSKRQQAVWVDLQILAQLKALWFLIKKWSGCVNYSTRDAVATTPGEPQGAEASSEANV